MKRNMLKKVFILSAFFVLAFGVNVFAQKSPKTATDFFLKLPAEFMGGTAKERAGFIGKTRTSENYLDFLLFDNAVPNFVRGSTVEPQSFGQLRLFKTKGRTIVGLSFQVSDQKEKNTTVDSTKWTTVLLEYKSGKWSNVTDSMMPQVSVDYAFKVLTEDFQIKDVKKEDVRVEVQVHKDNNALLFVGRRKGDDSVTILKWFKWTGASFVETDLGK